MIATRASPPMTAPAIAPVSEFDLVCCDCVALGALVVVEVASACAVEEGDVEFKQDESPLLHTRLVVSAKCTISTHLLQVGRLT